MKKKKGMERRAIDLSDEEDVSLSSSAYSIANEALSAGYEDEIAPVVVDTIGYENVPVQRPQSIDDDAYSGYVCVRTFSEHSSSEDENDEEEEVLPLPPQLAGRLAVGSGSLISTADWSERSRSQERFVRAFVDARKRRENDETFEEQLERCMALPDRRAEESMRKNALLLELVQNRLEEEKAKKKEAAMIVAAQPRPQQLRSSLSVDQLVEQSERLSEAEAALEAALAGQDALVLLPALTRRGGSGLAAAARLLDKRVTGARGCDWNEVKENTERERKVAHCSRCAEVSGNAGLARSDGRRKGGQVRRIVEHRQRLYLQVRGRCGLGFV